MWHGKRILQNYCCAATSGMIRNTVRFRAVYPSKLNGRRSIDREVSHSPLTIPRRRGFPFFLHRSRPPVPFLNALVGVRKVPEPKVTPTGKERATHERH